MNDVDLITIIGNLSRSLQSVDNLIRGISYLAGISLMYIGILKFKKLASSSQSQESNIPAWAYVVGGAILLFFPTTLRTLSYTTFGAENILQYTHYNQWDIFKSVGLLIETAGILWFVRGCIMMVHSSKPGVQEGPRGLVFILSGIFAMNFSLTMGAVDYIIHELVGLSFTFKK